MGVWLILTLCQGGSEADEGFADIPLHGEMNFLSGVVPFDAESADRSPFQLREHL